MHVPPPLQVLCIYLESQYGTLRVFPIWLLSGVAGALASAALEAACSVVVGASGSVFGLVGA